MLSSAMHRGADRFTRASSHTWYPHTRQARETHITWHRANAVVVYMHEQHTEKPKVRVRVVEQTLT